MSCDLEYKTYVLKFIFFHDFYFHVYLSDWQMECTNLVNVYQVNVESQ